MSSGQQRGGGGRRYNYDDVDDDVDRRWMPSSNRANVVKVQGIPYRATEMDLTSFFEEYKVSAEKILTVHASFMHARPVNLVTAWLIIDFR